MKQAGPRLWGEHIDFTINHAKLLNDVHFKIDDGSFTGLIGPNGSGKTTLLKTIYRLYTPSRGAVYVDGDELHSLKPRNAAQKMAVLPQEHTPIFDFPVMEMVLMARHAKKRAFEMDTDEDIRICERALRRLGLYEMRDRNFLSLSGGEKQRVLLASVFAQETGLIILDEPANHLDIGQQLVILDAIKQQPRATVFASIHDLNLAARYCDRIMAIKNGRIIAAGIPEHIITAPMMQELFHVEAAIEREAETGCLHIRYIRGTAV
ncbi:MAG: ABC transporter ATP-binding protein [Treponema sp.]|jgi:iron complex transport system ATP-binding protein|nr:ABC transporter ATP-binding protein [Treponema sp.]